MTLRPIRGEPGRFVFGECSVEQLDLVQKSQVVRAFDVILIGPLMLIGGMELDKQGEKLMGGLLSFFAISTMVYNAQNWWKVDRAMRRR